ncbi:MAG: 3-isopropylmalate dehydrogenase [Desulfobacteraceae bacterium]|nr:3-isopropylmalate dehydrogenase [Desulfobacteraceae bacterium]
MEGKVVVLPGDGIGPEITAEAVKVLKAVEKKYDHKFELIYDDVGGASLDKHGVPIRKETLEKCHESDAILMGALGDPKYSDTMADVRPESSILTLRKEFGLFGNIRPIKLYPALVNATSLKPERVNGCDLIVLRENTGGIFFGQPRKQWQDSEGRHAVDTMVYSEKEIERIIRLGFELARMRRKKLSSVAKFNWLQTSRLWQQIAMELAPEYPDVELEHVLIDACAMWLIQRPTSFDVLVMGNIFGDIISDEASAMGGSLGMMSSAEVSEIPCEGKKIFGLYESAHGSVPKRAGQNIVNPIAEILSVAMMLQYSFNLEKEAKVIDKAIGKVLEDYRTYDLMEPGKTQVGTSEMGDLIAEVIAG